MPESSFQSHRQLNLRADCSRCVALCCTAFSFNRSADFAIDKPAASPCPNLSPVYTCGIHDRLRDRGFGGCVSFDCFGAGQRVTEMFEGHTWKEGPEVARRMFAAFGAVMSLHELLWHLGDAELRTHDGEQARTAGKLRREIESVTATGPDEVLLADVESLRIRSRIVLDEVSVCIRASFDADGLRRDPELRPRADLTGRDLRGKWLCGANLRGALLLGVDLRGADLAGCDLLGADLRGADVRGADLADSLYLTRTQVGGARGDDTTLLPERLQTAPPASC